MPASADAPDPSTALAVGRRLVELCRAMQWHDAIDELYADDATHVEATDLGPDMPRVIDGKDAILRMSKWWDENHDVHHVEIKGPYPHGHDRFALWMSIDLTPKTGPTAGQRSAMDEVCLYHLAGDRISRVEFMYDTTGYAP